MTFAPTPRAATRIALAMCALGALCFVAGTGLHVETGIVNGEAVLPMAFLFAFGIVGVLVVSRQPHNAIGWIFCWSNLATGSATLADGYAWYWLDGNGTRSVGEAAAAYANAAWVPWVLIPATFLLLLFPDGRLLSRRWRWVAAAAAIGITGMFASEVLLAGELPDFPGLQNAYGVDHPIAEAVEALSATLLLFVLIASPASLYLRFRRARGQERQQIKWLLWAGALAGVVVSTGSTLGYAYVGPAVSNVVILSCVLGLPTATGVAILRYRLYDVDIVINRTLVYGGLTFALAATYLGLVLLAGLAVGESDLTIAVSTLAVAALFRPLRARIQAGVDRRFYRRRYDAGRTLQAFGGRLRDQIDVDSLEADLRGVVSETMQPAHVSLWLREPR